jgi:hypothetical protein
VPQPPAGPPVPTRPLTNPTLPARAESTTYDADRPKAQEIADFLERRPGTAGPMTRTVQLAGDLDLKNLPTATLGLVFDGGDESTLIVEPKPGRAGKSARPTIRLQFDAARRGSARDSAPPVWAALTVRSGLVKVRGLRFVVDAAGAPESVMAALYRQGGRLQVENCEFVQEKPSQDGRSRLSSLEIEGGAGAESKPIVTLARCCFLSGPGPAAASAVVGQHAVTLTGGAAVELTDCAFGPHAAVVALQGGKEPGKVLTGARVQLQHCSALLAGDSAVVRLENAQGCDLRVGNCLFSRPVRDVAEEDPAAVLVRQADDAPEALTWVGSGNRYHNLDAYWVRPAGDSRATWEEFRVQVQEDNPLLLTAWPWQSDDPLRLLDDARPARLREAFQVKRTAADLRQTDAHGPHLAGVEQLLGDPPYTQDLPAPPAAPQVARNARVVNPDPDTRGPGEYASLAEALSRARPGDVILLRRNGPVETAPLRLTKAGLDVTIKPYPDCRPVLTLDADTDEEEAALFRLHDGKLHLEGLQFHLRPANPRFKAQSVVAALGEGECTFKDCVITLEQAFDTRLAAVTLADLPGVMKMDRPAAAVRPHPAFAFTNCFVRGDGDLIAARAGRPFDLRADNLLVALGGSFLNREAADDAAAVPADVADALQLRHVTAYLGGSLVRFHARDTRALVPAQFKPVSDCLFVSAGGKALVHLDGAEASDDRLKALLGWEGSHNAYSKFPQLLDQQPDGGVMPAMPYTGDRWKEFTREYDAAFDRVKLDNAPAADASLASVAPARFRVKPDEMHVPDMQPYGADVDALAKAAVPADVAPGPFDE